MRDSFEEQRGTLKNEQRLKENQKQSANTDRNCGIDAGLPGVKAKIQRRKADYSAGGTRI